MALTEKQIDALKAVKNTSAVSIKGSVTLKAAGLIDTHGRAKPGWLAITRTTLPRRCYALVPPPTYPPRWRSMTGACGTHASPRRWTGAICLADRSRHRTSALFAAIPRRTQYDLS